MSFFIQFVTLSCFTFLMRLSMQHEEIRLQTKTNQSFWWSYSSGHTVTSLCVTNEKRDMVLQWQIWSTFVTLFADKVLRQNPPLPYRSTGSRFTWLEPRLNRSPHKANGPLVHSNSNVNRLLIYDVTTLPANCASVKPNLQTVYQCKNSTPQQVPHRK